MEEIHSNKPEKCHVYLASSKSDKEVESEVEKEEGAQFAKTNCQYFAETSSKTGKGIQELFLRIGKHLYLDKKKLSKEELSQIEDLKSSSILLRDSISMKRPSPATKNGSIKISKPPAAKKSGC
mmetsp:Transcript_25160/g.24926  ORF Transcript_25160/g.24926 Transcript_25160/m.24926 type:complete len:124 (-) Transcript_25160:33-404(-)